MEYHSPQQLRRKELGNHFLTKKECASFLKVSPTTIDNFRKKGILKAYRIGQTILFKRAEVEKAVIEI